MAKVEAMAPHAPEAGKGLAERILVFAPDPRDAGHIAEALGRRHYQTCLCTDHRQLMRELARGAAATIFVPGALSEETTQALRRFLRHQPSWADLPLIVLSRNGDRAERLLAGLGSLGNVTLLEPPVRPATLYRAVDASLRARHRQYEVRHLIARLRESDRRTDELMALLGHELRNPLGAIRTSLEILRHPGRPEEVAERQEAIVRRIQRQVAHLGRIVNDLLDLSRLTRGKVVLERTPTDLNETVRAAVEDAAPSRLAEHPLRVLLSPRPVIVNGDAVRLEQIVANLLQNAFRYTPRGRSIELAVEAEGDHGTIRVRDEGIGIDPSELEAIFDPFTQLSPSLDRAGGGLGLGLALVRALVEGHEGRITAASGGPDTGAEFVLRIPLHRAAAASPPARPAPAEEAAETTRPEPAPRVLVVEDQEDARQALTELLALWGCHVEEAVNGDEALALLRSTSPDLALVDIGLPGLDGYQLARRIRESAGGDRPRLVAMTGYGQAADRRRALEAGFDEHLVKPVAPRRLAEIVLGRAMPTPAPPTGRGRSPDRASPRGPLAPDRASSA